MRVGVLGGGESGVGAAILANTVNDEVFVSDSGMITDRYRAELKEYAIPFEEGGHTIERLKHMDCIVKSPGIPGETNVIRSLRSVGTEIISELEYAYRYCTGKIIAITGSNGKTTTTMLCHHILKAAGFNAALCGNVGTSFSRVVAHRSHEWYIVEVSSFQLDDVKGFKPDIAILLNITPDHLDRYNDDFEVYANVKLRIANRMDRGGLLIYNALDEVVNKLLTGRSVLAQLTGVTGSDVDRTILPALLRGKHDQLNVACVTKVAERLEIPDHLVRTALQTFTKPPHRMEVIGNVRGVSFIDDSKATNTDAVKYALQSTDDAPVIWIAGGQDKGNDYSSLLPFVQKHVKVLICLGIDNRNLIEAFSSEVDEIMETTNMAEAVQVAASNAIPGDTVLLSPACASFDLFENYKDRGEQFKNAVLRMKALEEE